MGGYGGYGAGRWASVPWGGAEQVVESDDSVFEVPIYPIPYGARFGRAAVLRFEGLPGPGSPVEGRSGMVFFSPSLLETSAVNSVDFAYVNVTAFATDAYRRPAERTCRVFRFGGGAGMSTNPSRTNATLYRAQPLEYTATATLVQTTPPGPTTVIRIP